MLSEQTFGTVLFNNSQVESCYEENLDTHPVDIAPAHYYEPYFLH